MKIQLTVDNGIYNQTDFVRFHTKESKHCFCSHTLYEMFFTSLLPFNKSVRNLKKDRFQKIGVKL